MTTQKASPTEAPGGTPEAPATTRKAWIPKTPVEVVLEQIAKAEKRVTTMRTELAREEKELGKLQAAKKVLEAQ